MNIVKRIWKFFIFTNLLIACAAVAQVMLSYEVFNIPYNVHIIVLEFTSTILLYNLSIYLSKPVDYRKSPYERTQWIFGHMYWFWIISIGASLLLVYTLLHIHWYTLVYLTFIGVLSLSYVLPILRIDGKKKSFRHLPYLKVFHIALIWALSTVGLVYVEASAQLYSFPWFEIVFLLFCKFLFILLVTLPFDIRDMSQDSYYHLKTVPLALGKAKAERLCYFIAGLHMLIVGFIPTSIYVVGGLLICDLLIILLFKYFIFQYKSNFLNVYLLDLVLIIQFVLVYAFTSFS